MYITIALRWIAVTTAAVIGGTLLWLMLFATGMLCAIFVFPFTKPAIPIRRCEWTQYYVWRPQIINRKLVWNKWIWRTWAAVNYHGWDSLFDYGFVAYRFTDPKEKTFPKKIITGGGGFPSNRIIRPYENVPYPPEDDQEIITLEIKV